MTLLQRWDWIKAAWAALVAAFGLGKAIVAAVPQAPPGRTRDVMAQISVAQLKGVAGMLGGEKLRTAVVEMTAGKPDGFLLGAEQVAAIVGVFFPQTAVIVEGIEGFRVLLPYLAALHPRPIQPHDPAYTHPDGNAGGLA